MKKRGTAKADPKKIGHSDFEKLELRVGQIKAIKRHPKLREAYVMLIDVGIVDHNYQVVASIAKSFKMTELLNKQTIVVCNMKPELVRGIESQALLLLTSKDGKPLLIKPSKKTYPGVQLFGVMNGECHYFDNIGDKL